MLNPSRLASSKSTKSPNAQVVIKGAKPPDADPV